MAKEPMMKLCDHGEIITIANEMPCEEDFDFRRFENKRRANWRRSWYHMRTKHPTAFYDEIIRSPGSSDYQLLISSTSDLSPEQIAIDREEGERFFRTLSLIDRKIILLRKQAKWVGFEYAGDEPTLEEFILWMAEMMAEMMRLILRSVS